MPAGNFGRRPAVQSSDSATYCQAQHFHVPKRVAEALIARGKPCDPLARGELHFRGAAPSSDEIEREQLERLPEASRAELLAFATEGDWTTPTCPGCGAKMVARDSKRGPFWGCPNFPRCRSMLPIHAGEKSPHRHGFEG